MKTQEEYAREIDEIVRRDVESCQSDWFKIVLAIEHSEYYKQLIGEDEWCEEEI